MRIWAPLAAVFLLDRLTKFLIQSNLALGESIPVIPGLFHLTYILNSGAAFGLLAGQGWIFIGVSIVVLVLIIFYRKKIAALPALGQVCVGLVIGGAVGNLFDRLWIGKVVDFLDFKIWSYIFNVADSGIVAGGFLLAFVIMRMDAQQGRKEEQQDIGESHV